MYLQNKFELEPEKNTSNVDALVELAVKAVDWLEGENT